MGCSATNKTAGRRQEFEGNVWTLVYQSGHTDTWCDGTRHIRCSGGWCWAPKPINTLRADRYKCDCAKWAEWEHKHFPKEHS